MEKKIAKTIERIERAFDDAVNPIVCFSGGKDSVLTLYLCQQVQQNLPVLLFQDLWSLDHKKYVQSVVVEQELTAYMYPPTAISFAVNGSSVIPYYAFGNKKMLPIVADVRESNKCGLDKLDKLKSNPFIPPYLWDVTVTGTRADDWHDLIGQANFDSITDDDHKIFTPLWDWTEEEVFEAIEELNLSLNDLDYANKHKAENADGGDFTFCLRCRNQTVDKVFCPKANKDIETI